MIVINHPTPSLPRYGYSIPVGTTFTGTIGAYTGLFLKAAYGFLVYLDNPKQTWNEDCFTVTDYRAVDIEVTYKEHQ